MATVCWRRLIFPPLAVQPSSRMQFYLELPLVAVFESFAVVVALLSQPPNDVFPRFVSVAQMDYGFLEGPSGVLLPLLVPVSLVPAVVLFVPPCFGWYIGSNHAFRMLGYFTLSGFSREKGLGFM